MESDELETIDMNVKCDDVHVDHCSSCYLMNCINTQCSVVDCSNGCGTRYHLCKEQDHLQEICSEQEVSCLNAGYGCQVECLPLACTVI